MPSKKHPNEKGSSETAAVELVPVAPTEAQASVDRVSEAKRIVQQYVGWSCAGGLVPVPLLDIAAITTAQLGLVRDLSALYGLSFQEHKGRNIVASLIGGLGSAAVGRGIFCSVLKAVPVVGTLGGLVSVPIVAGSTTYALGQVFIEHFERGGTLLDFNAKEMRSYFEAQLKEGQTVARATWEKTKTKAKSFTSRSS